MPNSEAGETPEDIYTGVPYFPYGSWGPLPKVPHVGHAKHLCDMAEKGQVDLNTFKELSRNPRFICKKCGRVAAKEENLCKPIPL
ncbi:MAG: hypothetical protein V1857_02875 [archaeon]